jgi:hypothetical protein
MDAVFTLPYPELIVGETLSDHFKKKDGFSVQIPLSRQQKGFDLLIYHRASKKSAAIQVRASRSYFEKPPVRSTTVRYKYSLWFKRFKETRNQADFYILFGLYPKRDIVSAPLHRKRSPKSWWHHRMLLFSDEEMHNIIQPIPENGFFSFSFDHGDDKMTLTRGADEYVDYSNHTLPRKINMLSTFLTQ